MKNKEQKDYWIPCPVCKEVSDVKVYEDTVLLKFPFYCPKCNQKSTVNENYYGILGVYIGITNTENQNTILKMMIEQKYIAKEPFVYYIN